MNTLASKYNTDFNGWVNEHIKLLKQNKVTEIDVKNLIQELEDMANRDRRELINRFIILIAHLLKWKFQLNELTEKWQEFEGKSWRNTIIEQCFQIEIQLENIPSLKSYLNEALVKSYPKALRLAAKETEKSIAIFSKTCPYSVENLLDEDFYPF